MIKQVRTLSLIAVFALLSVLAASCGGGGGGGGGTTPTAPPTPAPGPTTANKTTVSGTMNTVTAARSDGRDASAALANKSVIAYLAGDTTKTLLNSQSDVTGSNGAFSILLDKTTSNNKDIIIEAIVDAGGTSNVMVAIDNLTADKTGLTGNTGTTRKALLFHYAKGNTADSAIANISLDDTIADVDNIFANQNIDLRSYIRDSNYSTAALRAGDLLNVMMTVMTACSVTSATLDATKKSCIADELGRATALYNDSQNVENMLLALANDYRSELGLSSSTYIALSGQLLYEAAAARVAAADVGVQNAALKVYRVGDSTKDLLNSPADTTDSSGNFEVAVNIGSSASVDVIVEAVIGTNSADSILLAIENLASEKTGLVGNNDTSRSALMYHYAPSESLTNTISVIDGLFDGKSIDLRDFFTGADYSASSSLTEDLISVMKAVITTCGITSATITDSNKNCIQAEITTQLQSASPADSIEEVISDLKREYRIDLGIQSSAEHLQDVDLNDSSKDQNWTAIDTLAAIYDEVDNSKLSLITTESELAEILDVMSDSIVAWDVTYDSSIARRVAVKDYCMEIYFGENITYTDVKTAINNLRVDPDNGYIAAIGIESAAMASGISTTDMITIVSQYDNIRGMLINVLVNDVGETRENASAGVEAFLEVLAALGAASENTSSMGQVLDNWVVEWDKASVRADLMTALAPLDMDDSTKTDNLMRLAHDLGDLPSGASDAQIEAVLNTYLTQATTNVAMSIYNKYKTQTCDINDYASVGTPVNLNLSPSANCVSKEDIMLLMETHYEKDLPKLEAFIDGFEAYIEDYRNSAMLIGLYNAFASEDAAFQSVYSAMKSGSTAKADIGAALDAAGVKKELFWLAMNLEPYISQ